MNAQVKAPRVAAKSTKAATRAPKVQGPREVFVAMAKQLHDVNQTLSTTVYQAAMLARQQSATKEENDLLLAEIPKQRRAEYRRIVAAPAEHFGNKAPQNLSKLAKYLQNRAEGLTDAKAATAAEKGKTATTSTTSTKVAGKAKKGAQGQHKPGQRPPFDVLREGIAGLTKEYSDCDETILAMIEELAKLADDLEQATANI